MTNYILHCPTEPLEERELERIVNLRRGHDYKAALSMIKKLPQIIIDDIETIERKDILLLMQTIKNSGMHVDYIDEALRTIPEPQQTKTFNINKVINDLNDMLSIRYCSYPQPEIIVKEEFTMNSYQELIYMELYNQLRNAQQSCTQQPNPRIKLNVSTHKLTEEELNYIGNNKFTKNTPFVRTEVSDNGCGIDEFLLPYIFKKGETTKSSRGVGLALSGQTCYLLKGFIKVDSEVGKGTTFSMYLPQEI